jgi:hypothetical protein
LALKRRSKTIVIFKLKTVANVRQQCGKCEVTSSILPFV